MLATYARAGLVDESAELERTYIPVLALTNQPDKPQPLVEESLRRFVAAWDKFLKEMAGEESARPPVRQAIRLSTGKVNEARMLVAANKRKDAHEALETLRTAFAKARSDLGINYLPDRFTDFHDPMEEFAELAEKPGIDSAKLKAQLRGLSTLWKAVEETPLDVKLFKVSPERAARYDEQVRKEREILTQLDGLISSGNHEGLVKAAKALKGNFAQTYFVFGDFSGL
jgi:hypothetical protein